MKCLLADKVDETEPISVTADQLRAAILADKYRQLLEDPQVMPSRANWQYIIDHRMRGLGPQLMRRYLIASLMPENDRLDGHNAAIDCFEPYLEAVGYDQAVEAVYSGIDDCPDIALELVNTHNLFNVPRIEAFIADGRLSLAVSLLDTLQDTYTADDLGPMTRLLRRLRRLPELGRMATRSGMFHDHEAYFCPKGHANPAEEVYCRQCGLDIHGLTEEHIETIERYEDTIKALRGLLANPPQ